MINYNTFHKKNCKIQRKLINSTNYVYQTIIKIIDNYFSSGNVLDVGCGVGTIDFYIANKGIDVVGCDISSDALSLAEKSKNQLNIKNVRFVCSKVEDFSFKGQFDYVICMEVLEHIENYHECFKKIVSLTKKGGYIIVSTPSSIAPLYRLGLANKFDKSVGHLRRFSKKDLIDLGENNKLKTIEFIEVEGLLRNSMFILRGLGLFVRFVKGPIRLLVNYFDQILLMLFGPSNYYVVYRK